MPASASSDACCSSRNPGRPRSPTGRKNVAASPRARSAGSTVVRSDALPSSKCRRTPGRAPARLGPGGPPLDRAPAPGIDLRAAVLPMTEHDRSSTTTADDAEALLVGRRHDAGYRWFVLHTRARQEKVLAAALRNL